MKSKLWKEIIVAVLLISTILYFSPIAYGETTSVQQSIDAVKMEMKQAALSYVEPALKGNLVPSSTLDPILNSVKKNYEATKKLILVSNLSEQEKQAKLKELEALYQEKIVKGLIPYIDAYNYATKYLDPLLKEIKKAEAKNDFLAVEKAYHKLSVQLKSRTSILYRFSGKAARDLLLEKYKKPADQKRDELIIPVTIIMKATTAQQLLLAEKKEEAQKAIEEIQALTAKLSSTHPFHLALIKELERLQAIFFPVPITPIVPTPPVIPPSTGGSGDSGGSSETSVQRALRLAKTNAIKDLANYKETDYSPTNWKAIEGFKTKWTSAINSSKTIADVAQALTDAQKEIDLVKTDQDLVNAEAVSIAPTFTVRNPVGTISLPTVGGDYTISVNTTSDSLKYDKDGKIQADGTSQVVYTVTHTASGKTADTGPVTVTVIVTILKVPPVLNAAVEIIPNSSPSYVFTFIDNPDWRNNIFSIRVEIYTFNEERLSNFVIREGKLTSTGFLLGGADWVLRVKATGYEDSLVPIVIN